MNKTLSATIVAAAIALSGVIGAVTAQSQDQNLPAQIVYVDMFKIESEYRKYSDLRDSMRRRAESFTTQARGEKARIDELLEKLDEMRQGTAEFEGLRREIEIARMALEYDLENGQRELAYSETRARGLIYRAVIQEAQALAEEQGYAAVVSYTPIPEGFERMNDSGARMRYTDVLWCDSRLDISSEVAKRLNLLLPPPAAVPGGANGSGDQPK